MQNLVKTDLENLGCENVIVKGKKVKAHFKVIKSYELSRLHFILTQRGIVSVELKRSGTGITVLVEIV